jgi:hypothetical protein
MTNPMVRIHNADTDTIIDREMTKDELTQYEIDSAKAIQEAEEKAAKAAAKDALLERLGITADEAALLLG